MAVTWLKNLRLTEISFVDKGANPGARVVIAKRDQPKSLAKSWSDRLAKVFSRPVRKESSMSIDDVLATLPDDQKAVVMSALEQAAVKAAPPPPAPAGDPKKEPAPPDVTKSADVPEHIKKRMDEQDAEIAKMKAEKRRDSFIVKAKALPFIPGKTEETAAFLEKAADSMKPADFAAFEKKLAETNAVLKKSKAFAEVGSSQGDEPTSALAKLHAFAAEAVVKSEGKLTKAQAFTKVAQLHPDLYEQAEAERARGARSLEAPEGDE